ncbi:MAG: hypothetical protein HY435_02200 [Candidatus Liptonbacteria bacterium]|nr:hypothetical protein [Candidatus Liptonbacteria bacterium]
MQSDRKTCKNCNIQFVIEPDDFSFYKKMGVPAPILCPECRFKRRALFRNETTLYTRKCDLCKKSVISMYNPKLPYTIYCERCYESDAWDPFSYTIEYDEGKPFFEQLGELFRWVPKMTTFISASGKLGSNVNSEYTNVAGGNKDCYLIFNGGGNENVLYSRGVSFSRDSLDGYFGLNLERCYETVNVNQSNGVCFGHNVNGSVDSIFLLNASGCQNCFACVNLRNKSHHFFNEPLSKKDYEKRVGEIRGSFSKMEEARKQFEEFSLKFPRRENNNLKTIRSTGDYLVETKNLHHCFEAQQCEDSKYLFSVKFAKDCYDLIGFGYDSELLLENVGTGYSSRVMASYAVENSQNVMYSFMVRRGTNSDCIGCDSVRNAKYCILNKRYDEKEYHRLRRHIVNELEHMKEYGLFMPPSLAPFAYNETVGQDNLPFTKEEALRRGLRWEEDIQMTTGRGTMKPAEIPDHIKDVPDSITNEILACVSCGRNYNVIPAELQFYRRMIVPIPRQCFFCRQRDRIRRRGPMKIFDRACAKCEKPIKTTYAPERPEIVYCEPCYQAEVV